MGFAVKVRISYSGLSDWARCNRYYYYRHILRTVRLGPAGRPLGFGRAGHKGQEALWSWAGDPDDPGRLQAAVTAFETAAEEEGLSFDDRILGQVLLIGYAARWDDLRLNYHMAPLVERKVVVPVLDPTGNPDPDMELVAVFDVVAYDLEGNTVPVEHKFTASPIEPGAAYWGRLDMNLQASIYWIVATDAGRQVGEILWDAIRAPQLTRWEATPSDKREFYKRATKRADGTVAQPGDPKPGVRLEPESVEAFTERVMGKVLGAPAEFYGRQPLYRSDDELDRVRADVWQTGKQIQRAAEDGTYPRNLDACNKFNMPCPYLPVCKGEVEITDERIYQVRLREEKADPFV